MSSPIEVLWRQALKTFSGRGSLGYKFCEKNFEKLHSLINKIKADDVKVDEKVLDYVEKHGAPMCVIDVFENQDITIAVFLLKHGVTLPMHDHPEMHGLLKVLCGTVKIDSFTTQSPLKNMNLQSNAEINAVRHPSIVVEKQDPACVLSPHDHNIHEITCIKGPAAFLDILSPPYKVNPNEDGIADRPCTFFEQISVDQGTATDGSPIKVKLMTMEQPRNFYSNSIQYSGPSLR